MVGSNVRLGQFNRCMLLWFIVVYSNIYVCRFFIWWFVSLGGSCVFGERGVAVILVLSGGKRCWNRGGGGGELMEGMEGG